MQRNERLEAMQQAASAAFAPLRLTTEDFDFDGGIRYATAGGLLVADITGNPGGVWRPQRLITSSDPELYKFSLHLSGSCMLGQDGRHTVVNPGDLVVYDTTRPYGLVYGTTYRTVVVGVPRDRLAGQASALRQAIARPTETDAGLRRVVAGMLNGLAEDLDATVAEGGTQLADALLSLLGKVFTGDARLTDPRTSMRERVVAYCEANLGDPDLSVEMIAQVHGISQRYLHKLFAGSGTTIAALIRTRRLQRIRDDLADPGQATVPVAAIAARWGVLDPTHVSRLFRAVYGTSPIGYRRQLLDQFPR
ncbi:helix-turn-helix domain-containing protein [Kutzneria sp. CA-103260]|uniref:AraC-like ligand-binding domain-containing protein n=1 Tax=Kutzneria sp. CA-103260 TaxID=2802641 RepID=UPI001BA7E543|nr:helix-turn-helix domain-containing protein [Kutzneria sp. CA-103260]